MNTASRMESHGVPGRIQCSDVVRARLAGTFLFEERGEIDVKGKGRMRTSFPIYALAWRWQRATGLAIASGIGILAHTLVLVALAPRLLPELREGARAAVRGLSAGAFLAALAGAATWATARGLHSLLPADLSRHLADVLVCAAASVSFALVVLIASDPLGVPEPGQLLGKLKRKLR